MNPKHLFQNLQRAAGLHPACRRVSIWQVAHGAQGHVLVAPGGPFEWAELCHAHAAYDFGQPDEWAGPAQKEKGAASLQHPAYAATARTTFPPFSTAS